MLLNVLNKCIVYVYAIVLYRVAVCMEIQRPLCLKFLILNRTMPSWTSIRSLCILCVIRCQCRHRQRQTDRDTDLLFVSRCSLKLFVCCFVVKL